MIDYDLIANSYDSKYKSVMSLRENKAIKVLLKKYRVPQRTVLDVGCGTGFALDLIDIPYYQGIDVSPNMIDVAKKKHRFANFNKADIKDMSAELLGKHGAALCLFSIPYIGVEAVDKIYETLVKDGICICVYYNKPYLNPDSVYYGRKQIYDNDIKPNVEKVVGAFLERFSWIEKHDLTTDETYTVCVLRKD